MASVDRDSLPRGPQPATPDQPDDRPKLAGLVLCGGASRRMGVDKALLEIDGQVLVDRVAGRLLTAGASRILLATGTPGRLGPRAEEQVADDPAAYGELAGPLAGIVAGLTEAHDADLLLVAAVDLPHASPDLFRWLVDQWRSEPALVPVDANGRPQPLHAVYATAQTARQVIDRRLRQGERRVMPALDEIGARYVEAPPELSTSKWAENWNEPHPGWG
jgi:molybdopterin-guanine dinucleotide biosynthesis protein A